MGKIRDKMQFGQNFNKYNIRNFIHIPQFVTILIDFRLILSYSCSY